MRDFYRPQTKFAKVMFSQVSVCPQERRGGGVSVQGRVLTVAHMNSDTDTDRGKGKWSENPSDSFRAFTLSRGIGESDVSN